MEEGRNTSAQGGLWKLPEFPKFPCDLVGYGLIALVVTDLAVLVADPDRASTVPPEQVPELLGALERVRAALLVRLLVRREDPPCADRLLAIDEAAARLSVTKDWLRRQSDLPFRVRLSAGQVRYSEQGIEEFIRRRQRP